MDYCQKPLSKRNTFKSLNSAQSRLSGIQVQPDPYYLQIKINSMESLVRHSFNPTHDFNNVICHNSKDAHCNLFIVSPTE